MHLSALRQLLRGVREAQPKGRIILFGSSSLLISFPSVPPRRLGVETTLDADLFTEPDFPEDFERMIDAFGEGGAFYQAQGVYADITRNRLTAHFPAGWRERLVPVPECADTFALHPTDAAAMKPFATATSRFNRRMGRGGNDRGQKDVAVVAGLVRGGLIPWETVASRLDLVSFDPALRREFLSVLAETEGLVQSAPSP